MKFKCKKCGSTRVEEVLLGCTQLTEITGFEGEYHMLVYGEHSIEDGEVNRYQCLECGETVKDEAGNTITTEEELFELIGRDEEE